MKRKNISHEEAKGQNPFSFYVFVGFIILFLPVFYMSDVMDETMMPRLLALCIFLFCFALFFLRAETFRRLDFSVLRHPLFPIVAGYFLVTLLSLLFAFNYKEGIYDSIKTFVFISVFALGAMLFVESDNWQDNLPKFVIVSAVIACIVGFVQYYNRVLIHPENYSSGVHPGIYAVDGIMSHKNLFSISLLMMIPFIAYGIYCLKGVWKSASIAVFIMLFVLVFILKTRAVWLGLGISFLIITIPLVLWSEKFNIQGKWRIFIVSVTFIILLVMITILRIVHYAKENSTVGYLASITNYKNELNVDRLKSWSMTTEMIKDHFFTGVGAGNWQINLPKYYKNRYSKDVPFHWIRPHNDYLWVMAEKGIVGLILFLLIFVVVIYNLFVIIIKSTANDRVLSLFLLAGIIGYMIASFFDFPLDRPFHQAFLAIYLICTIAMVNRIRPRKPATINRLIIFIPFMIFVSFGILFTCSAIQQEIYINRARAFLKQKDWRNMLYNARKAVSPLKNMDQVANPVAYYVGLSSVNLDDLPAALKAFSEAYNLYPDDYTSILNLARVKEKFNLHDDAEKLLQKGLKIYSDNPVLQKELCDVYYSRGEFIKAYIMLRLIPGWEKDSILIVNIRVLENKMGIAQRTAEEIHTPDYRPDESIKYYLARITEDPSWLELIVKKAAGKGISLQKMELMDAKYMAELQIRYYQSRIIKDPAWIEIVR